MILKLLRTLKRRFRQLIGQEVTVTIDTGCPTEFHGSTYGGWAVLRDSLDAGSVVYSFGVGEDATFDLALIARYGCRVHAFDPTPKSAAWVAENIREGRFIFDPVALSDRDGDLRLYLPLDPTHVSASLAVGSRTGGAYFDAPCQRLETIRRRLGHSRIDVLKMDIEGAEYLVLRDLLAEGRAVRPAQLLIEFHHWMKPFSVADTNGALALLRRAGYRPIWRSEGGHELLFVAS